MKKNRAENVMHRTLRQKTKNMDRSHLINFAGIVGIIVNVLLASIKLLVGMAANSISIISDAANNLTDAVSSVITIIGLKLATHSPDRRHPLGYGRIEYISGMIISALVLITGLKLLETSVERIITPVITNFSIVQYVLLGMMIVGKWLLSRFNFALSKVSDSDALLAMGTDDKMDALASLLTLLTIVVSKVLGLHIDGYIGSVVALFIIYNGISLIKKTGNNIIGERPSRELTNEIKEDVLSHKKIIGAYDLIVHNYGPTIKLGTMNVEMPDYISVEEAYETMVEAQRNIYKKYGIYITFGLYSVNTYDEDMAFLRRDIKNIVKSLPGAVDIHNFNYDRERKIFRFDVVLSFYVKDYQKFRELATAEIVKKHPETQVIMNVDLDVD